MKRLDQSETSDFLPGGAPSDEPSQSGAMPHWWHTSAQNLYSNARIQILSGNQEDDVVLKKRVSRPHREEETSVVWPNMCDDKQGFAKYLWKKPPEIRDDKRDSTLNTAELLPNMCANHHCMLIVTNIWPSVINIWIQVLSLCSLLEQASRRHALSSGGHDVVKLVPLTHTLRRFHQPNSSADRSGRAPGDDHRDRGRRLGSHSPSPPAG